MGIYRIKPRFRHALGGAAADLATRGVTPDRVTSASIVASCLGTLAFVLGHKHPRVYAAVPIAAFARITANSLDGLVAEKSGLARPAGELYNETADRLGDIAFFTGAATVPGVSPALALGALAMAETASFVGVAAKAAGAARRWDGPMGKPDRMLVLGAAALFASLSARPDRVINVSLVAIGSGAVITACNRYRRAKRELEAAP